MKVLVLGSTGRTGTLLIEELLKKGHNVVAIARNPVKLANYKVEVVSGTPYDYDTVEKAISGCDAVINTLNVSRVSDNPWAKMVSPEDLNSQSVANVLKAGEKYGTKRIVVLSTFGAGDSWDRSPLILKLMVKYSNLKFAFDDHTRQEDLLTSSGFDYTICRAPRLTSQNVAKTVRVTEQSGKPSGTALSRKSVAEFFVKIIENKEYSKQIINFSN